MQIIEKEHCPGQALLVFRDDTGRQILASLGPSCFEKGRWYVFVGGVNKHLFDTKQQAYDYVMYRLVTRRLEEA